MKETIIVTKCTLKFVNTVGFLTNKSATFYVDSVDKHAKVDLGLCLVLNSGSLEINIVVEGVNKDCATISYNGQKMTLMINESFIVEYHKQESFGFKKGFENNKPTIITIG